MKSKLLLIIGLGAGYVLGARAGREKYDAMKAQVDKLWENPRVARARRDVEAYTRQQAPIIRARAEAAAKAAPGAIADAAKDVANRTSDVAKTVADSTVTAAKTVADTTSKTAKAVAEKTTTVAKDVADKTSTVAKDVADKTKSTAKAVADKATDVAADVRGTASSTAASLRGRGEEAVTRAVAAAGTARDNALDDLDDDATPTAAK